MAADNTIKTSVETMIKGMDHFITSKTVVGEPITVGDTILVPLVDISFGLAAGASSADKKNGGTGGMGGKISPSSILVIQNGHTKLVNCKNTDAVSKIIDMVPELVDKFTNKEQMPSDDEVKKTVEENQKAAEAENK